MANRTAWWLSAACLWGGLATAAPTLPPDLSPLSDFGSSEIQRETALIHQLGDKNNAAVDQEVDFAGQTGHYVEINQTGAGNQVSTNQQGDLNRIRVNQNGSGNTAQITQVGMRNSVDLVQLGQGNRFESLQVGNDNLIVNLQPGGAGAILEEHGNNNVIMLNQSPDKAGLSVQLKLEGNGLSVKLN